MRIKKIGKYVYFYDDNGGYPLDVRLWNSDPNTAQPVGQPGQLCSSDFDDDDFDEDEEEILQSILGGVSGKKRRRNLEPISQWNSRGNGKYSPAGQTTSKLPPALYSIGRDQNGPYLEQTQFPTDDLIRFPDGPSETVVQQVEKFWSRAPYFKENGLLHKRGILLYGPAGCGKSSVIKLIIEDLIVRDGVVLVTDVPTWMPDILRMVRSIEAHRPIVNIIEDIDDKMKEADNAVSLLAMLDGEHQVDNILHIATTNYPERLEERITQRPGRFDLVIKMDLPSPASRKVYLSKFPTLVKDPPRLEKWVGATDGFGIAHMRELVAAVECMGLDFDETLSRLKDNKKKAPKRKDTKDVGFDSGKETR